MDLKSFGLRNESLEILAGMDLKIIFYKNPQIEKRLKKKNVFEILASLTYKWFFNEKKLEF